MVVTNTNIYLSLVIALLIAGFAYYLFWSKRKFEELEDLQMKAGESNKMKLGAYERLALFAERVRLENLVAQVKGNISAREARLGLVESLREEYDYNVTQQLYVKPEIWDAINRMKNQNIYIINQIASLMPAEAGGEELKREILNYLATEPNATLNNTVLEAINYEVKQILG